MLLSSCQEDGGGSCCCGSVEAGPEEQGAGRGGELKEDGGCHCPVSRLSDEMAAAEGQEEQQEEC